MRVLHALDICLPVSQNWIYPQIKEVAGVQSGVLCGQRTNPDLFPLESIPVFQDPPPSTVRFSPRRLISSLFFRIGRPPILLPVGVSSRKWKPDLIHAHFGTKGWGMLSIRKRLHIPLVTSFYGTDAWQLPQYNPKWRERYKWLFSEGACFFVEGPAMGNRLIDLGCPADKIKVVRLGINPVTVPFEERDFTHPLWILMIARFVEKKGFVDGLEACAQARRSGIDLKVRIVGDAGAEDPVGQEIKSRLSELAGLPELRGCVSFEGFVPPQRVATIMKECNVFLCPSKHSKDGDAEGGSPVVLTQAMATGLLCVGTRHCDIPEVIVDGQTGYLCESGDIDGIASRLARIVSEPLQDRELTRRGRKHIETSFSTEGEVSELKRIYTSTAASAQRFSARG
jgi:colanic acid/amylovoran biosynthesis glycosyltransferase